MKFIVFALLLALLAPLPAEETAPVISMRWSGGMRPQSAGKNPGLLFAAWADGKIAWSQDQEKGGEPFLTARLEPSKITGLLTRWSKTPELGDPKFRRTYVGPDLSFLEIALLLNEEAVELDSWHEGFEANPNLVALPGIAALEGRKREEVLKTAPKDFLRFREIWKDVRDSTTSLLPKDGEPYHEVVPTLKKKSTGKNQ